VAIYNNVKILCQPLHKQNVYYMNESIMVMVMVFNTTFNNMSVISWRMSQL